MNFVLKGQLSVEDGRLSANRLVITEALHIKTINNKRMVAHFTAVLLTI